MKILFDFPLPYFLAHGGAQIQIEETKAALQKIGMETEYVRWWDETQCGDIIHYFGRPLAHYLDLAHRKGMRVVMAELLGETGARSWAARKTQKLAIKAVKRIVPLSLRFRVGWEAYEKTDACIALTAWEAELMTDLFSAPRERTFVVPNGVEAVFLESKPIQRGPWLVCVATVSAQKRVLELAQAALLAQTPLWVIGRPYSESDDYFNRFVKLARTNSALIRYEGPISDRATLAQVYRGARGFVLFSTFETLSLSGLEAAACQCPLLLTDLPWAHGVFGDLARYAPLGASLKEMGNIMKAFYADAPTLKPPPRPAGWSDVAEKLRSIYELVLKK